MYTFSETFFGRSTAEIIELPGNLIVFTRNKCLASSMNKKCGMLQSLRSLVNSLSLS